MYIVLEIQLNNGTIATLVDSYTDRNAAESKYHTVLASAAISEIDKHSAVLLADNGIAIKHESYIHAVEPEPEVEE